MCSIHPRANHKQFLTFNPGYTPVETALNMISYIGKETDFTVWKTVFSHLKYISEMLSEEDVHLSVRPDPQLFYN